MKTDKTFYLNLNWPHSRKSFISDESVNVLCSPCVPCCPDHIRVYTCSSHSDSIHPPCCHSNTSSLKPNVYLLLLAFLISLTVTASMSMALAVNMSVLTFTVVTLTVGALYNAGSPDAVAAVSVSVTIAVTSDNNDQGELEESDQDPCVHGERLRGLG